MAVAEAVRQASSVKRVGSMAARHDRPFAAVVLALLIGGFFAPALIGQRVLTPASGLYVAPPWSAVRPSGLSAYVNLLLGDNPTQFLPWVTFARDAVHHGFLPAWNPLAGGGTPFFANAQAALLSPFTLIGYVFPLSWALGFIGFLKLWLAGFGTYLLLREFAVRPVGAMLAGVSFAFCSFNVVWLSHPHTNVSVFLPAVLWFAERILARRQLADGLLLALTMAVAFLGGHPGTEVQLGFALIVYVIVRSLTMSVTRAEATRALATVAGGAACGAMIAAVMLVPAAKAVGAGASVSARLGGGITNPLSAALTIAFPDWWGRPTGLSAAGGPNLAGPTNYNERTLYAGAIAVILAVVALSSRRRVRITLPFAVLGAVGIATSLGAPIVHPLIVHLPGLDSVQDARMLLYFELAISVLAGVGLDEILKRGLPDKRYWGAVALAALVGVVAVLAVRPDGPEIRLVLHHILTGRQLPNRATTLSLASIGWWSVFVACLAAVGLALPRRHFKSLAGPIILALAALDAVHFAHGYQPMAPSAHAFPPQTPAIRFLERHRDQGRTVGIGNALPNDYQMVYRLSDIRSYDPPFPDAHYLSLWRSAYPEQRDSTGLIAATVTPVAQRLFAVLSARYIVQPPAAPMPPVPGLRLVYRGPDGSIYDNTAAVPEVMVPRSVSTVSSDAVLVSELRKGVLDPEREALVEDESGGAHVQAGRGLAVIVEEENARVDIQTRLSVPGLVVLNDTLAPGWTVTVDGRPAARVRVNGVMRGVSVPAGRHTVRWEYAIPGLGLGLALTALGAALVLTLGVAIAVGGRNARRSSGGADAKRAER